MGVRLYQIMVCLLLNATHTRFARVARLHVRCPAEYPTIHGTAGRCVEQIKVLYKNISHVSYHTPYPRTSTRSIQNVKKCSLSVYLLEV